MDVQRKNALALMALSQLRAGLPPLSDAELSALAKIKNLAVAVQSTSSQGASAFVQLHPATDAAVYDFCVAGEERPIALALVDVDPRISHMLPRLVPKELSEHDFWFHYISHVVAMRVALLSSQMRAPLLATHSSGQSASPRSIDSPSWQVDDLPEIVAVGLDHAPSLSSPPVADTRLPSVVFRLVLDFGAPRMLDVMLRGWGLDRSDVGHLLSGEALARVMYMLRATVADSTSFLRLSRSLSDVRAPALRDAVAHFQFRADRDEPALKAVHELNPAGVRASMQAVVPRLVTESEGLTFLFSNIVLVVYFAVTARYGTG